jgi:hypothetical protein
VEADRDSDREAADKDKGGLEGDLELNLLNKKVKALVYR